MGATEQQAQKKAVLKARGRLKEARKLFAHRGWDTLPQGRRGQRILAWCAIQAWLAYPSNPEAAVRRVCSPLAPYLKEAEWIELVAETKIANKNFSHDQSAMVLEIPVSYSLAHGLRFLGADNDPDYRERHQAKRERNAACQRKRRAARSTGRPCGRPALPLSEEERLARSKENSTAWRRRNGVVPRSDYEANSLSKTKPWEAEGISRRTYERRRKAASDDAGALRKTPSPDKIRITGEVTGFSVTDLRHEVP